MKRVFFFFLSTKVLISVDLDLFQSSYLRKDINFFQRSGKDKIDPKILVLVNFNFIVVSKKINFIMILKKIKSVLKYLFLLIYLI